MSYHLKAISSNTVDGIKREWFKQLDNFGDDGSYLNSSIERIIDWCDKALLDSDVFLWELCEEGLDAPHAIVEIADASKSKDPSFKFLNIYLEPRLILDYKDEIRKEDLQEVISIFAYAMMASLDLAQNNGTSKLKVYGRTDEMRNLFDSLVLNTDTDGIGVTIYRQGKWLVIDGKR